MCVSNFWECANGPEVHKSQAHIRVWNPQISLFFPLTRGSQSSASICRYVWSSQCIHKDLAARNVRISKNLVAKVTNIGSVCDDESSSAVSSADGDNSLQWWCWRGVVTTLLVEPWRVVLTDEVALFFFLAGKYVEIKVDVSRNIRNIEFHNTRWRVSHAHNQSINQSTNKALA